MAHTDGTFLRKTAIAGGLLTWLVVCVTFVGLLGGTHPSDALRDRVIGVAAGLVAVLSAPAVLWIARRIRRRRAVRVILVPALLFLVHIVAATGVLRFVQGISHEHAP